MLYKERAPLTAAGINASITSSYFLANTRMGYQFDKHWSAFVSCNNMGNIQYSDLLGSKMPNRWWTAGAGFKF
jgi:iron complex outermembrane receptor protein